MTDEQSLILLLVLVTACIAAAIAVGVRRARKRHLAHPSRPQEPEPALEAAEWKPPAAEFPPVKPQLSPRLPSDDLPPLILSPHGNQLWQRLLTIVLHDAAKADRLMQFEIDELHRKERLPEGPLTVETVEDAIQRAIERWQRENAG